VRFLLSFHRPCKEELAIRQQHQTSVPYLRHLNHPNAPRRITAHQRFRHAKTIRRTPSAHGQ
jgi:hypothetical protein